MLIWSNLLQPIRSRQTESVPKSPNDNRSPFKKDFDTVCNSTILRRLQDKAQVFPLEKEDYARTRLTHSIEVMSICESLGYQAISIILSKDEKYISESKDKENETKKLINDIPFILKTAALLHDMGNPPFGHLGEEVIGEWFRKNLGKLSFNSDKELVFNSSSEPKETLEYLFKGSYAEDLKHFEGNAQLLRLVTKLCFVVDDNGMNLSFPVMASFIKYPTASTRIDKNAGLLTKKMGYFSAEQEIFKNITSKLGLKNCRHPLAYLLEAADDIAYLTADIEDAHRKGLISLKTITDYFEEQKEDKLVSRVLDAIQSYIKKAQELGYEDEEDYVVHRIRVLIKGLMIDSMNDALNNVYDLIMQGEFNDELINVSSACCIAKTLRKIEKDNIYYCSHILKTKTQAIAVLNKLLDVYVPAIVNWNEKSDANSDKPNNLLYLSLSKNYRYICQVANQKYKDKSMDELQPKELENYIYNKILLVTDQISGMTDSHALTVYRTITANSVT
ncbi:MAG: dNTP triphosphohydrolase [Clostridia bacterium]|nr:dNTP triphosphohydrolase [Clostridia bacterium]